MEQTINIRNVRGGATDTEKGGLIGYRLDDEKHYLKPGDNEFPAPVARKILGQLHHQNVDHNGKKVGKPVTNGEAWQAGSPGQGPWVDIRYSAPEWNDESAEFAALDAATRPGKAK